ncbi:PIG-L family deacetylase [Conyzicola sp.]|uniref:PIG-L family deacetylase n=1 Tax=Conyzicola sp. TaxID=1969404 RepID=UPI0039895F90
MSDLASLPAERVLFVHAHPDDESITTGGTIAALVGGGAAVTVLTCTRGELGEVIPADLQHLLASGDALAAHRESELAEAMRALRVTDHRYLGDANARWVDLEPRRYRDSGMRWGASGTAEALDSTDERSLSAAPLGAVTADIAAVISDTAATAVVSYDERGGYGHPDHVRAHDAARRAAEVMGVPYFEIVTDARGPVAVDVTPVAAQKRAALAAHRTQLTLDGDTFALSNGVSQPIGVTESFRRVNADVADETVPFHEQTVSVKIGVALLSLVFGALIGTLMTAAHQSSGTVGDLAVPWGLVLALVASTGFVVGLRVLTGSRILPILATVGIMGATAYLASPTVGGSVIVPANFAGVIWTFAPAVVILVVVAWPNLSRIAPVTAEPQPRRG